MDSLRKRYFTDGEPTPVSTKHAPYLHVAHVLLDMVKQRMQMGNLQQLWQQYTTEDGATIRAMSRFGQDEIWIDVPNPPPNPAPQIERKAKYGRFLIATGPHGHIYQLDPFSLKLKLATDMEVTGCPAYIAVTPTRIAIADNLSDYYKYGSEEWNIRFASGTVTYPQTRFYSRQWEETGSYTPYTSYAERWQTTSHFSALVPQGSEFLSISNISRFWGFTVGGGDNEYYIDRLSGEGALASHLTSYHGDPNEWAVTAACADGSRVRASLVGFPYSDLAYQQPTFHFGRLLDEGIGALESAPYFDHMAADSGRFYATHTEFPWMTYTLSRIDKGGAIKRSVEPPASVFPLRFPRVGDGYLGMDDRETPSIRTLETYFPYGRMAAGAGRLVVIGKISRFAYELHVYDASLNLVGTVPLDPAAGFLEGPPSDAFSHYVLPGDYTVAIGYDPYWIPEHITEKRPDFGAK